MTYKVTFEFDTLEQMGEFIQLQKTNSAPNSQQHSDNLNCDLQKVSNIGGKKIEEPFSSADTIQSTETKVSVSQKPAGFQDKHKAEIDKDYDK